MNTERKITSESPLRCGRRGRPSAAGRRNWQRKEFDDHWWEKVRVSFIPGLLTLWLPSFTVITRLPAGAVSVHTVSAQGDRRWRISRQMPEQVLCLSVTGRLRPEPSRSPEETPASSSAEQMSAARELLSGQTAVGSIMAASCQQRDELWTWDVSHVFERTWVTRDWKAHPPSHGHTEGLLVSFCPVMRGADSWIHRVLLPSEAWLLEPLQWEEGFRNRPANYWISCVWCSPFLGCKDRWGCVMGGHVRGFVISTLQVTRPFNRVCVTMLVCRSTETLWISSGKQRFWCRRLEFVQPILSLEENKSK